MPVDPDLANIDPDAAGAGYLQVNLPAVGGTVYAVQRGDQYIGAQTYRVQPFPTEPPPPPGELSRRPSWMLEASHQVVPFTGRHRELSELSGWRDDPGIGSAVRLLHGPGGQGKTRLATEFGRLSAAAGWMVRQASLEPASPTAEAAQRPAADARGVLLVVDYAERWPHSSLMRLFQDRLLHWSVPVRVLLMARPAGLWWSSLRHRCEKLGFVSDELSLRALASPTESRRSVFEAARDRFAELLDVPDSAVIAPPQLIGREDYGLVLTLHMSALAAVDARAHGEAPPADALHLSAYLLHREAEYWQSMYGNRRVMTSPEDMARAVFIATLAGPMDYDGGIAAFNCVGLTPAGRVLGDQSRCYPTADAATVLEPLRPDRLGEDFIALQLSGHPGGWSADPWAIAALGDLLGERDDAASASPGRVVAVLAEAAHRWQDVAERLHAMLLRRPFLAIAAGGAGLNAIGSDAPVDVLEAIEPHLPGDRNVDLDAAIATIVARLTAHRLDQVVDDEMRAQLQTTLAWRLANAGMWERAVAATEEAVEIYRRLVSADPVAFESHLARALNSLGMWLSDLGHWEQALAATEQAVQIHRRLAAANPTALEFDRARALTNFARSLFDLGRWRHGLDVAQEGVEIFRRLAAANHDTVEPYFATALNNLSIYFGRLGQREQALAAVEEAVEIRRRLAAANPEAYEPDLATVLLNLGVDLSKLSRLDQALAATEEAVEIRRRLAAANPAAFEPDLATALNNLGIWLSGLGRSELALAATDEAVDIYRRLATANFDAVAHGLASSLINLGSRLSELGRQEQALATIEEAVEIGRRLAAANPAVFEHDLASAFDSLGGKLSDVGRHEQALVASEEAVETYRRLSVANPEAYEPDLARALGNLSIRFEHLGRRELALAPVEEAVEVYRRLAAATPAAFEGNLASTLNYLGALLAGLGRWEQALATTEEAIEVCRRLVAESPAAFESKLAIALTNLGSCLSALDRGHFASVRADRGVELTEAAAAGTEAVEIYRRLAEQQPRAFSDTLRGARDTTARILESLGRWDEANHFRFDFRADGTPARPERIAPALVDHGESLGRKGRSEGEIAAYDEVVRRFGELSESVVREQVAKALVNKAVRLGKLGQLKEAIAVYDDVGRRFGRAQEPNLRKQVAIALVGKGDRLGELGQLKKAIAVYDEVTRRFSRAQEPNLHEQVAIALVDKGGRLVKLGRLKDAIAVYDEVRRRFGGAQEPALILQVATALVHTSQLLDQLGRREDSMAAHMEAMAAYEKHKRRCTEEVRAIAESIEHIFGDSEGTS